MGGRRAGQSTEFCKLVENTLGWLPDMNKPAYLRYNIEAAILHKRMDREKLSEQDLMLALRWAQHERRTISPSNLTYHVEEAKRADGRRQDRVPLQIDEAISEAVQHEYEHHPGDLTWV